ncbi:MAG: hypothetical protein KTR25_20155 [Myxococcales bacterium]|nr:hypothetical protein [Myxococcales bacterium]
MVMVTGTLSEDILLRHLGRHTPDYPGVETLDCLMEALSRDPDSGINYVSIIDGLDGEATNQAEVNWEVALASKKMGDAKERIKQRLGARAIPRLQWSLTQELAPYVVRSPSVPPASMKKALIGFAAAAETFNRSVSAAQQSKFTAQHLQNLVESATNLTHVVDSRPDLALRAHQVRSRTQSKLTQHALHAASTAYIAALIASALEVHPQAKRVLAQIALFTHLPMAVAQVLPSPHRLELSQTNEICASVATKISNSAQLHQTYPWWHHGWRVAREYRLSIQPEQEQPVLSLSKLIGVAAAYDALVSTQSHPVTASQAITTLAKHTSSQQYDAEYVTILAAVIATYR